MSPSLRIALIVRPDFRSPRVLAESLQALLREAGAEADLCFEGVPLLNRLVPLRQRPRHWYQRPDARLRLKLRHFLHDRHLLARLRRYDAVVFCECTPNGFWRGYFGVEQLRAALGEVPLLYHSVFWFRNAPRDTARWLSDDDFGPERYTWHLAVSPVTELRLAERPPWSSVGLDLRPAAISPHRKQRLNAIIDFAHFDTAALRPVIVETLDELGIPWRQLSGEYSFADVRAIYESGSLFFLQMQESFGVSIAENFAAGNFVFVPATLPPVSWRLDAQPTADGTGRFGPGFRFYGSRQELKEQLSALQSNYNPRETPVQMAKQFAETYPHFYHGNPGAVKNLLLRIKSRQFS